ncbi:MAG: hypothetical protein KDA59_15620 [Planctomycetales bacterium]|nr:hypothetical protein [Planctomycetales bacterium]
MTRFLLAATLWSCAITTIVVFAEVPENPSSADLAPAIAAPVYVKVIWQVDPATAAVKDHPVMESWIVKSIKNGRQANLRAVTAWVPLFENRDDVNEVWDGKSGGVRPGCPVRADIVERKDGRIKIAFRVCGADPVDITLTLQDEPGSRKVVPVTLAETKHGVPHFAGFIGAPVK